MKLKSFFVTVAKPASAKKIAPVPPAAVAISASAIIFLAMLTLDRRLYTIVGRTVHGLRLRGPAGGRVDLHAPLAVGNVWTAWHGGIGQRNAKLVTYRRQPDGSFVRVRY